MVITGTNEVSVTLIAEKPQLRLVQLLLSGNTLSEAVDRFNKDVGFVALTVADGLTHINQFALALQPGVGFIVPRTELDKFLPTKATAVQ
jgi:hypothetical protein